jgi:hypothetical protein
MLYKRTEFGWPILLIVVAVVLFNQFMAKVTDEPDGVLRFIEVVEAVIILIVVPFFVMTVQVDGTMLSWSLCFGLFPQSVPIASIESVGIVDLSPLNGYGIRGLGSNKLWRISGSRAVSLQLADGRTVAIGVSDADQLANAISSAIGATHVLK